MIISKMVLYILKLPASCKPLRHFIPVWAQLTQSSDRQAWRCCWIHSEFHLTILLITALAAVNIKDKIHVQVIIFETEYI